MKKNEEKLAKIEEKWAFLAVFQAICLLFLKERPTQTGPTAGMYGHMAGPTDRT